MTTDHGPQDLRPTGNPAVAGHWQEITLAEYVAVVNSTPLLVGETYSDPDGCRGEPHVLTTWIDDTDRPVIRHQCWPVGHGIGFARPCLREHWVPAVRAPSVCPVCLGVGVVGTFAQSWCEGCRCGVCGAATDTPPECKTCAIAEDAAAVRREDRA